MSRRGKHNLSCCSLLSLLLLRTGPAASAAGGGGRAAGLGDLWCASPAHVFEPRRRALGAFVPAWVALEGPGSLRTRVRSLLLRGGCAGQRTKPTQCSFCTKVQAVGDRCKADRTMASRAAEGRRTADGWALLSTDRGASAEPSSPSRDDKVGQPKGLSEYGWGETAYAKSAASQPVPGKKWAGDFCVLGIETSCDDTAAAVVHSNGTILGESKRTQDELHAKWGGVVPGV
jgi:hypothetical protein